MVRGGGEEHAAVHDHITFLYGSHTEPVLRDILAGNATFLYAGRDVKIVVSV